MSRTYRNTVKGKRKWVKRWDRHMTTPSEWNLLYHQKPFRRKNKDLAKEIVNGTTDAQDAVFPKSHRKPHIYYW